MTKIQKNDLTNIIISAFLSAFFSTLFTWIFTTLTKSLNPIIVLYAILSTLGALILFHRIEKLSKKLYEKGGYWLEIYKYNKKVDQMVEAFQKILLNKEIYIVDSVELTRYFDSKIQFYKPSQASFDVITMGRVKDSTLDVINRMINSGILIYIESVKLLLLKEKMICSECGGSILFHDKIDYVNIKCQKCAMKYRITSGGLLQEGLNLKLIIRIKNLDRLRY